MRMLLLSVVVCQPIQLPHYPLTTFRSGQDFKYRTNHIMCHTTFSHLKLSMPLPHQHQTLGYSDALTLPLSILIHLKSGQAVASMVCIIWIFFTTNTTILTICQVILLRNYGWFFVLFPTEEIHYILARHFFSAMLSASKLSPSRTSAHQCRIEMWNQQVECTSWNVLSGMMGQSWEM